MNERKKPRLLFNKDAKMNSYKCPRCNSIININNNDVLSNSVLLCPVCEQPNVLKLPLESSKKKQSIFNVKILLSDLDKNAIIVGLILLFVSVISLLTSSPHHNKTTITLVILGVIIGSFVVEKKQDISLKITAGIILLILLLYLITGTEVEMFLILIFISVSIIKIILNEYLPITLKMRMNLFLSAFFVIFMYLVIKRIINVVNI
jgi:hypothetical protein